MVPDVLYVTSFAPDMYLATGRRLVKSFLDTKTDGTLLCCTENVGLGTGVPRLLTHEISQSGVLADWLKRNEDIIPTHLGGKAGKCSCPDPDNPRAKTHKPSCVGQWFNRNASRWFRKLVALDYAIKEKHSGLVIWLDSDCYFKKAIPSVKLLSVFGGRSVFYMRSKDRKILESGILGMNLSKGGAAFIEKTMSRYLDGTFREYPRWDDGYMFQMTLNENRGISAMDIASRASGHADVARHSSLAMFLAHQKGTHGRGLKIMT